MGNILNKTVAAIFIFITGAYIRYLGGLSHREMIIMLFGAGVMVAIQHLLDDEEQPMERIVHEN